MSNKFITLLLSVSIVASGFAFAAADSDGSTVTNFDKKFFNDFSASTAIADNSFNPAEFTIDAVINSAEWLGITSKTGGSVSVRTDAKKVDLSSVLPNLDKLATAEELALTSMAGNTFTCRNQPVSWVGGKGQWETVFNDPTGRVKTALDSLGTYIAAAPAELREDEDYSEVDLGNKQGWYDSYIVIPAGTSLLYGNKGIRFTAECELDEIYDPVMRPGYYASTFAEVIYKIKTSTESFDSAYGAITISIPKDAFLQFGDTRFTVTEDLTINILGADTGGKDPVSSVLTALNTAVKTDEKYIDNSKSSSNSHDYDEHPSKKYFIHTCDEDAVFSSGFALLNEFIGVLAQKDAKIIIAAPEGDDADGVTVNDIDPNRTLSAEFKVTSAAVSAPACTHSRTRIIDKIAPTVTTVGYSGDTVCADCGLLLKEGSILAKLPSSIKLNYTSLKLKKGQSTSVLKVTFVKGDRIRSVTSSNNSIVKAVKNGTNGIKLTAGQKTGTATVSVKLAGGKSAKVTVKVQKTAVKCTGLKIEGKTSVTLKKGKTYKIKVKRTPVTCVQKITYKSSNKKVAKVTSAGKVKAVKKGTAKIKVKCGTKTKTISIKVK